MQHTVGIELWGSMPFLDWRMGKVDIRCIDEIARRVWTVEKRRSGSWARKAELGVELLIEIEVCANSKGTAAAGMKELQVVESSVIP